MYNHLFHFRHLLYFRRFIVRGLLIIAQIGRSTALSSLYTMGIAFTVVNIDA